MNGEVKLVMEDYHFTLKPTKLAVTWTCFPEVSFMLSKADEQELIQKCGWELRVAFFLRHHAEQERKYYERVEKFMKQTGAWK